MILSILICSLNNRAGMLATLLGELERQVKENNAEDKVEILVELDNGELPTGTKRNMGLQKAVGKYICWHDDDDWPYPCYVSEILKGAESDADCMAINGIYTQDGGAAIKWKLSKDYPNETVDELGQQIFIRKCNHIAPVKRELALLVGFHPISNGEDKQYSEDLNPLLRTEVVIEPPLYHYRYTNGYKEYLK
jgi:glycosyltransferase involved in cell wall biosynthesis